MNVIRTNAFIKKVRTSNMVIRIVIRTNVALLKFIRTNVVRLKKVIRTNVVGANVILTKVVHSCVRQKGATTLSIMTVSITTLCKEGLYTTLSINEKLCTEWHCAECHYA